MRLPRLVRAARDEDELQRQRQTMRWGIPVAVAVGAAAGLVVGLLETFLDWRLPPMPQDVAFWVGLVAVVLITALATFNFARTQADAWRAIPVVVRPAHAATGRAVRLRLRVIGR